MPDEHSIWLCCRIYDDPTSHNLLLRCADPTWTLCSFGVLFLLHAAFGELGLPCWHSPTDILPLGRLRIQKHSICMPAQLERRQPQPSRELFHHSGRRGVLSCSALGEASRHRPTPRVVHRIDTPLEFRRIS